MVLIFANCQTNHAFPIVVNEQTTLKETLSYIVEQNNKNDKFDPNKIDIYLGDSKDPIKISHLNLEKTKTLEILNENVIYKFLIRTKTEIDNLLEKVAKNGKLDDILPCLDKIVDKICGSISNDPEVSGLLKQKIKKHYLITTLLNVSYTLSLVAEYSQNTVVILLETTCREMLPSLNSKIIENICQNLIHFVSTSGLKVLGTLCGVFNLLSSLRNIAESIQDYWKISNFKSFCPKLQNFVETKFKHGFQFLICSINFIVHYMFKMNHQNDKEYRQYSNLIQSIVQKTIIVLDRMKDNFDNYKKMANDIEEQINTMKRETKVKGIIYLASAVAASLVAIITANPIAFGFSVTAACINVAALLVNLNSALKLKKIEEDFKKFDNNVKELKSLYDNWIKSVAPLTNIADQIVLANCQCYDFTKKLMDLGNELKQVMLKLDMKVEIDIIDPKDQTDDIINVGLKSFEQWFQSLSN